MRLVVTGKDMEMPQSPAYSAIQNVNIMELAPNTILFLIFSLLPVIFEVLAILTTRARLVPNTGLFVPQLMSLKITALNFFTFFFVPNVCPSIESNRKFYRFYATYLKSILIGV